MSTIKEKIRRGGPTKTVPVWIGAPMDLVEEYEQACKDAEDAGQPADSLAGTAGGGEHQMRLLDLRRQLDEFVVFFTLRGLDDKRYQRLKDAHPPRQLGEEVHPRDRFGFNYETMPAALVRACTVAPDLDDGDWLALFGDDDTEGSLTGAQVDALGGVAVRLCTRDVDVPFWSAASPTNPA